MFKEDSNHLVIDINHWHALQLKPTPGVIKIIIIIYSTKIIMSYPTVVLGHNY